MAIHVGWLGLEANRATSLGIACSGQVIGTRRWRLQGTPPRLRPGKSAVASHPRLVLCAEHADEEQYRLHTNLLIVGAILWQLETPSKELSNRSIIF